MTEQPAPPRWLPWLGDPTLRGRLRNAFLLLLIGLLAGAIAFAAYQALRADDLWRQAQQALADRDFDRARACLGDYLALRPGSAEGHFLMARTCRQQRPEDFETAHTHLALARELGWPDEPSTLEGRLLTFQAGGGPFARERPLRESVEESSPDLPLLLEGLARGCIRGDRLPAANSYLDAWVQLDPDDWYPRLWRGALFQHTGKADLAVADYQRVLQARPGDVQVKKHLGLMLVQSGHDYQEAL